MFDKGDVLEPSAAAAHDLNDRASGESLVPDQFPMRLYARQAQNLSSWAGDLQQDDWLAEGR